MEVRLKFRTKVSLWRAARHRPRLRSVNEARSIHPDHRSGDQAKLTLFRRPVSLARCGDGTPTSPTEELHRQAMAAARAADQERAIESGSGLADARARGLLFQAFDSERQSARSVDPTLDPSHSVLYRSAASLAFEGDLPAEALATRRRACPWGTDSKNRRRPHRGGTALSALVPAPAIIFY